MPLPHFGGGDLRYHIGILNSKGIIIGDNGFKYKLPINEKDDDENIIINFYDDDYDDNIDIRSYNLIKRSMKTYIGRKFIYHKDNVDSTLSLVKDNTFDLRNTKRKIERICGL